MIKFNIFFNEISILSRYIIAKPVALKELKMYDLLKELEVKLLRMLLRSYVFLIFKEKKKKKITNFSRTYIDRSSLCETHFRVDSSRRRRAASTRIAYESSRWGPSGSELAPLGSSSSLVEKVTEEKKEEEEEEAVEYHRGNSFVSFCPPTQRRATIAVVARRGLGPGNHRFL